MALCWCGAAQSTNSVGKAAHPPPISTQQIRYTAKVAVRLGPSSGVKSVGHLFLAVELNSPLRRWDLVLYLAGRTTRNHKYPSTGGSHMGEYINLVPRSHQLPATDLSAVLPSCPLASAECALVYKLSVWRDVLDYELDPNDCAQRGPDHRERRSAMMKDSALDLNPSKYNSKFLRTSANRRWAP
ncbi:hypothetical protein B0H17DRAFT_1150974 [Mycena rosella]|uniref:Uncharacterized protein n=1 Tax=Mycena rosella TaxID=1033263 RepID=A0AAD7BNY9_MYCRO|nr:hypothetical protein B0H17DRAFT_1150974 [Mycena rosella]